MRILENRCPLSRPKPDTEAGEGERERDGGMSLSDVVTLQINYALKLHRWRGTGFLGEGREPSSWGIHNRNGRASSGEREKKREKDTP